jgi:acid phosphatase family membrane protein YuiD
MCLEVDGMRQMEHEVLVALGGMPPSASASATRYFHR